MVVGLGPRQETPRREGSGVSEDGLETPTSIAHLVGPNHLCVLSFPFLPFSSGPSKNTKANGPESPSRVQQEPLFTSLEGTDRSYCSKCLHDSLVSIHGPL